METPDNMFLNLTKVHLTLTAIINQSNQYFFPLPQELDWASLIPKACSMLVFNLANHFSESKLSVS